MTPVPTLTSLLAVIIPIESTFVTSSYVNAPPTDTLPENTALFAVKIPTTPKVPPVGVVVLTVSTYPLTAA